MKNIANGTVNNSLKATRWLVEKQSSPRIILSPTEVLAKQRYIHPTQCEPATGIQVNKRSITG